MNSRRQHQALGGRSRARLLDLLRQSSGGLDIAELAGGAGLHPNTAREQLRVLIDAGLVQRATAPPAGRGRPRARYVATPQAGTTEPTAYRELARSLADELGGRPNRTAAAARAGERWGARVAARLPAARSERDAIERLVAVLDDAGFEPDLPAVPGAPIGLRRCPFGTLAQGREPVICGVHLGLMRGVLRTIGAPVEATGLDPWVTPDLCLAHVAARTDV